MTEQLAFDQALWQRPAIDANQGAGRARRVAMQCDGYQLLAGSAFTDDQDGGVASRLPAQST